MALKVNEARYDLDDPRAIAFFEAHGFVVLRGVLSEPELQLVEEAFDEVVDEGARASSMPPGDFVTKYPQNRDLWQKNPGFRTLLFDTRQGEVARRFLGTSGARLFHDHAIAKPAHASGTIPWHQDSAYWPLDRVGVSLWSPTADVGVDGGCLELIDGSHLDGPGVPQDFLASDTSMLDRDPRITCVPVQRGECVVLTGLTWHRSCPNLATGRRLAYLTLWVPATARFRPEHAGWHPCVRHSEVAAGARLEGEWFPLFGEVADQDEGEPVAFPVPVRAGGPSMFTASKDIRGQIAWLLERTRGGREETWTLADAGVRELVADECVRSEFLRPDERVALVEVLEELHINEEVRRRSIARDLYLQAPLRWWTLVGTRVAEEMVVERA